jgi:hypothetical protein
MAYGRPGRYDLRSCVGQHGLPDSLEGKSALDVGTCDGFCDLSPDSVGEFDVSPPTSLCSDLAIAAPMSRARTRSLELRVSIGCSTRQRSGR